MAAHTFSQPAFHKKMVVTTRTALYMAGVLSQIFGLLSLTEGRKIMMDTVPPSRVDTGDNTNSLTYNNDVDNHPGPSDITINEKGKLEIGGKEVTDKKILKKPLVKKLIKNAVKEHYDDAYEELANQDPQARMEACVGIPKR
jgi:hypothetical protein